MFRREPEDLRVAVKAYKKARKRYNDAATKVNKIHYYGNSTYQERYEAGTTCRARYDEFCEVHAKLNMIRAKYGLPPIPLE